MVIPVWWMLKMFSSSNVIDAKVMLWDSDDTTITHYHLYMHDDVMAPEDIISVQGNFCVKKYVFKKLSLCVLQECSFPTY